MHIRLVSFVSGMAKFSTGKPLLLFAHFAAFKVLFEVEISSACGGMLGEDRSEGHNVESRRISVREQAPAQRQLVLCSERK